MQTMYVANCSRQIQAFTYRVPGVNQMRSQDIPVGNQLRLSNLKPTDIEAIIRQYDAYGMISVDEIGRARGYAAFCYSLDKPVSSEKMTILAHHNNAVLGQRGREMREQAAVVVATNLGNEIHKQSSDIELGEAQLDIIEDDTPASQARRAATGEDRFHERTFAHREGDRRRDENGRFIPRELV